MVNTYLVKRHFEFDTFAMFFFMVPGLIFSLAGMAIFAPSTTTTLENIGLLGIVGFATVLFGVICGLIISWMESYLFVEVR